MILGDVKLWLRYQTQNNHRHAVSLRVSSASKGSRPGLTLKKTSFVVTLSIINLYLKTKKTCLQKEIDPTHPSTTQRRRTQADVASLESQRIRRDFEQVKARSREAKRAKPAKRLAGCFVWRCLTISRFPLNYMRFRGLIGL